MDLIGHSDPYTEIVLDMNMIHNHMFKTDVIDNTPNPDWNQKGDIHYKVKDNQKYNRMLIIKVNDHDLVGSNLIGKAELKLEEKYWKGEWFNDKISLFDSKGNAGG